jgi:hypothetical protein
VGTKIKYLIAIVVICLMGGMGLAYGADVARQVDFLASGLEQDGNALSGGKVYTYEAGTTTAKTCYINRAKANKAANPVILSSEGRYTLFCDGVYKMVIKDSSDVTLVTMDGISYGEEGAKFVTMSSYSSLAEAIADIGSTKTVLIIDATDTLDANVTVPSNVTLMPMIRDALTLGTKTLTVNGDIWAGAFEWIIGTGTFAGSPVVQFYDPTWTASTVTDSATPSYKSIVATLDTPTIGNFANATHTHSDASGGGSTLTGVTIGGASSIGGSTEIDTTGAINATGPITEGGNGLFSFSGYATDSDTALTIGSSLTELETIAMGTVTAGDILVAQTTVSTVKGATGGLTTIQLENGSSGTAVIRSLSNTSTAGMTLNVPAADPLAVTISSMFEVTTGGSLVMATNATSGGSDSTPTVVHLGGAFLSKQ